MHYSMKGKASMIVGGQWGSEGKGAAAAHVARQTVSERHCFFNFVTTNAGAQAGHTSIHNGIKRVVYHLPTAPLVARDCGWTVQPIIYLNAGSIIDPDVLRTELDINKIVLDRFFIHPNAAVITDDCREAEGRVDSAQTKIASTRKGVGEALSRKILRGGLIARDHEYLNRYVRRIDLNSHLTKGDSVLIEVPQGFSLGVNGKFWPHCTSRDCTVQQGLSDAGIHPSFLGPVMMVIRTYPIRVGNIHNNDGTELGNSGGHYHDQREMTWDQLGVQAEITTVTGRIRRVFTFSRSQLIDAMSTLRPDVVYLAFCDYMKTPHAVYLMQEMVLDVARIVHMPAPEVLFAYGPTTDDVHQTVLEIDPHSYKTAADGEKAL